MLSVPRFRTLNPLACVLPWTALLVFQGCFLSLGGENEKSPDHSVAGYYAFISPAASARLDLDSSYPIRWSASDAAGRGPVRLSVYRGNVFLGNLSASLAADGGYEWKPADSRSLGDYRLGSASGYRLRLANVSDSSRQGFSDPFSIVSGYSGTLALTAPGPGYRARIDSSLTISWSSTGRIGEEVGLQLFRDTVLVRTLAPSVPAAAGSFLWPSASAPAGPGNDYHIRIFAAADPSLDRMGSAFTLASAATGSFAFRYPGENDTVATGAVVPVGWTVTGVPGDLIQLTLWRDAPRDSLAGYAPSAVTDTGGVANIPGGLADGRYRFRIAGYPEPDVFAFSSAFYLRRIDPDAYESDGTLASAKAIGTDGALQRRTLTPGDVDWIRFDAAPGRFYRVVLTAEKDLELDVKDSSGTGLLQQQGRDLHFAFSPLRPGPHYMRVYPASSADAGWYQVAVTGYDSSATYKAAFSAPDSNAVWKAGSDQTLAWTPDSAVFGSTVALLLLNDTAFVATIGNYLANSGRFAWTIPYDIPSGNRYRIRISSMASGAISASSPAFAIDGLPPDAYEPDDGPQTAKDILGNATAQQRNILAGESDWCRFQGLAGMHYTATVGSFAFSIALSMRDSAGVEVAADTSGNPTLTYEAQYNGIYYLKIQGLAGAGNYSVKLAYPP